jgi:hypothetical protein
MKKQVWEEYEYQDTTELTRRQIMSDIVIILTLSELENN